MVAENVDVCVVIPACNEEELIGKVVQELVHLRFRVVVVNDGSSDRTGDTAASAGATVLQHVINRGQGAALQTGIDYALALGARRIVTFDADGQHDPAGIHGLLAALDSGAQVALGSRFLGKIEGARASRVLFLQIAVKVSNFVSGVRLTDAHCGLRAFGAEMAERLQIRQDGMSHASELLHSIARHRLRFQEVPVTVRYTAYSQHKGQRALGALRILLDYIIKS